MLACSCGMVALRGAAAGDISLVLPLFRGVLAMAGFSVSVGVGRCVLAGEGEAFGFCAFGGVAGFHISVLSWGTCFGANVELASPSHIGLVWLDLWSWYEA